mmetsp:Transcript_16112/g.43810  ORF Transcript_16112/g.43810 Transcript_16112/m.43810 type:complete len:277 (-) Transcript_16112:621-1451(-)
MRRTTAGPNVPGQRAKRKRRTAAKRSAAARGASAKANTTRKIAVATDAPGQRADGEVKGKRRTAVGTIAPVRRADGRAKTTVGEKAPLRPASAEVGTARGTAVVDVTATLSTQGRPERRKGSEADASCRRAGNVTKVVAERLLGTRNVGSWGRVEVEARTVEGRGSGAITGRAQSVAEQSSEAAAVSVEDWTDLLPGDGSVSEVGVKLVSLDNAVGALGMLRDSCERSGVRPVVEVPRLTTTFPKVLPHSTHKKSGRPLSFLLLLILWYHATLWEG